MLCVVLENRWVGSPMLIELRWKLYKVARSCGARKTRVFGVSKHAVQRVTKFVEHRPHIIRGEEGGLAGSRHGEIGNICDYRSRTKQLRLVDIVGHPGAALLVVAFKIVAVKECQRTAVGIKYLEHAHARCVHRKISAFLEGQSVELVRRVANAILEHIVQLEIR